MKERRGMHLLIIGGSDAGISAALRAKECAPWFRVTVMVSDSFPNYSICGLPFLLSGEVTDWRTLAHRTIEEIESAGIHLLLNHRAIRIDSTKKLVTVMVNEQSSSPIEYDKLIIATGAVSVQPLIEGLALPGAFSTASTAKRPPGGLLR